VAVAQPVSAAPAGRVVVSKGIYMQLAPVVPAQKSASQVAQPAVKLSPLMQAAQLAFGDLIDVANKNPDACGFLPSDNLLHARLGEPIQVYQTTGERYISGQPVKSLLKPAARWMVPVMIGDQIRCMVQVKTDGKEFVPGSPSKILGVAWNKIMEKWPASAGYHPQLIVNPEMPGYYFSVPELAQQNLTETDKVIYSPGDLSPASVILASWR
jgi:hypothetical protein